MKFSLIEIWYPSFRFIDRGAKTKRKERLSGSKEG